MTLQQLKYAIEIANCGSINEAAKKLFISQPSLSNAIKELEGELGIIIFDRTNRGISISLDGVEFLGYARQIIEQTELIENRYHGVELKPIHFSISTQHYTFAVNAFIKLINKVDLTQYEFSLKETKTYNIIQDVRTLHSDIGILYINETNSKIMNSLFSYNNLKFTPLFNTNPYIFINKDHPLAHKKSVTIEDVKEFPYITFEQGNNDSSNFSEEILNLSKISKSIHVNDRATMTNLLITTNSYTIGTGIIVSGLNGNKIKSIPIESESISTIGWITHKDIKMSKIALCYINILNDIISTSYDLNYCLL